jgi:hypothetical protein
MNNPQPLSIAVVRTLWLPAIFLWEEKFVAHLIATPNVDKCNRRQTRKVNRARLHATREILMQNEFYSLCKQLGQNSSTNYAMSRKNGG